MLHSEPRFSGDTAFASGSKLKHLVFSFSVTGIIRSGYGIVELS